MPARFAVALVLAIFAFGTAARAAEPGDDKVKTADAAKGAQIFTQYCVTCHGPTGLGDGPVGKTLNPPPRNFQEAKWKFGDSPQAHFEVITNGAAAKGGSPLMAPWGAVIPEADRWAVVKHIISLKKKK